MLDVAPSAGFPPSNYQAGVIEGLDLNINPNVCSTQSQGDWISIIYKVDAWITAGLKTIVEVTPQSYCDGNVNDWLNLIGGIQYWVAHNYPAAEATYWGGFMLDEEPGYGFSAQQLQQLNQGVTNIMNGYGGFAWYYTEDQPNGWDLGTYNSLINGSVAAPQVYTQAMLNAVNNACSQYHDCANMVTNNLNGPPNWNNWYWVNLWVNGSAWRDDGTWGGAYWCNVYQNA